MRVSAVFAWVAMATGLLPAPAPAGEVPLEQIRESRRATVSAAALNLRAEPSLGSAVIAVLPHAWPVAVLDDDGPSLTINGRSDHWTRVATFRCADAACDRYESGWVADSHLAFDDRFALLKDGPAGIVAGYDARSVFAYDVANSGDFMRWRLPCSAGSCSTATGVAPQCAPYEELALGSVCVVSGTLHRHGGLIRGQSRRGGWLDGHDIRLVLDASGSLCPLDPAKTGGTGGCARSGHAQSRDDGPAVAIARLAAERRQVLALTAASHLNLRDHPSHSGGILARLPRASAVERQGVQPIPVILDGRRDEWVKVAVVECAGPGQCPVGATGWVMESYLAYEDRLAVVTDWPETARLGNQGFGFEVLDDGTFRHWQACGTGEFGLEICRRSGRLYRYRDLIVMRDDRGAVYPAFLADSGRLCVIAPGLRRDASEICAS